MKKYWKLSLSVLVVAALSAGLLIGCSQTDSGDFSYSTSIDDKGYWKNVKATDYVVLPDDMAIEVSSDVTAVSDEDVQSKIDSLLASSANKTKITDRAVAEGDTINFDYVGTIDGTEFEGGNTNGQGTEATIGVTSYIPGFLEQVVGHMPGESFEITATFPEDYMNTDLAGKTATFATTVNYISESTTPELTDTFVKENMSSYGWQTVDEMKAGIASDLQSQAVQSYLSEYLVSEIEVKSIPQSLLDYQNNAMLLYYTDYAKYYEVDLDEFLSTYIGVDSKEALIENNAESNEKTAKYALIIQAVAEKQGMTATDEDVKNYFAKYMGLEDYSQYEEQYGMNYLKQVALSQKVLEYLTEQAKVAS